MNGHMTDHIRGGLNEVISIYIYRGAHTRDAYVDRTKQVFSWIVLIRNDERRLALDDLSSCLEESKRYDNESLFRSLSRDVQQCDPAVRTLIREILFSAEHTSQFIVVDPHTIDRSAEEVTLFMPVDDPSRAWSPTREEWKTIIQR